MTRQGYLGGLIAVALVAMTAHTPNAFAGKFGLMLDGGVPDGGNVSLVFRPLSLVRVNAGASHNYVSRGVRAGVTLIPIRWFITPTVSVEAGRFFPGDANRLARSITGDAELDVPELREFSYDFAAARFGLEFGSSRFTFYIQGGAGVVDMTLRNFGDSLLEMAESDGPTIELRRDPKVRVFAPSARLGFIFFL